MTGSPRGASLLLRRATIALSAVGLILIAAGPAGAQDLHTKRDQTQGKQKQVKAALSLALYSDTKVEAEVSRLTSAVGVQQAKLDAAKSAETAANAQIDTAARRLTVITTRIDAARHAVITRAVRAYVDPSRASLAGTASSPAGIAELVRGQALLSAVTGQTADAMDAFRQARQDQVMAKRQLETARAQVAERVKAETAVAAQLVTIRGSQETVAAELQHRIADLQNESRQLGAQQGQLEALIRSQDVAAQATLAQQRAESVSGRPSGNTVSRGAVSNVGLMWPVHGVVTSEFGPRWGGFHPGMDIAPGGYGAPIHAAKAGVVIFAGWYGGYGNFVVIDHGGGIATAYGHQEALAVTQGQLVSQGQVIGYVGSTGYSTGPHLHFEVRANGVAQNPRNYGSGSP